MSSEWRTCRLSDVISIKHGFAFKGEYFSEKRTPYQLTTPGNFAVGGGFQRGQGKFYSGPVPSDYILCPGDVIVTMTDLSKAADTLGYAAFVPHDPGTTWLHNQRVGLLQLKHNAPLRLGYVQYLMRSPEYRHWVVSSATGSTVKHTSPSRICEFEFALPSLYEQDEIAAVLGALDHRINLLRETNATLEAIAQALFKSWFVDFDPVRAKQEGQLPKGMDDATAALFPDSFEESKLGSVPMGWKVVKSGDVIDIRDGTHASPKQSSVGFPFITTRHISTGKIDLENAYLISAEDYVNFSRRSKVDTFDVLISMIGTVGVPVIVLKTKTDFAVKNIGILKTSFEKRLSHFIYLLLKSRPIQHQIEARLAGTTQKYLALSALRDIKFVLPSEELLEIFSQVVMILFNRISHNDEVMQSVTNLRNTLLPRLISGQLRLLDAVERSAELLREPARAA
jgi:type I restriction enzyme S subunit